MSSCSKRKRNCLSVEIKQEILERLKKGENQTSLAKEFNIGKSTVSEIKKREAEILQLRLKSADRGEFRKRKSAKPAGNPKLDDALYLWFTQRRIRCEPISGPLLCKKALDLNKKLNGSTDFKASSGWLKNFKLRHGLRLLNVSLSRDYSVASEKKFQGIVEEGGYTRDNESGINWKVLPSRHAASAPSFKVGEEPCEWVQDEKGDPLLNEESVISSQDTNSSSEDNTVTKVKHSEALRALTTALNWYEEQEECELAELLIVKRVRDLAERKANN